MRWYEYLFSRLGSTLDEFKKSRLSIVSFNYDRSLEYFFYRSVKRAYGVNEEKVVEVLKEIPFVHVYGQLGKPHFFDGQGREYNQEVTPDIVAKAVKEVKIVHELDIVTEEFKQAYALIEEAQVVAFLGFGFHPVNVQRLQMDAANKEKVYGTAYHLKAAEKDFVRSLFVQGNLLTLGEEHEDVMAFIRRHPVFL